MTTQATTKPALTDDDYALRRVLELRSLAAELSEKPDVQATLQEARDIYLAEAITANEHAKQTDSQSTKPMQRA